MSAFTMADCEIVVPDRKRGGQTTGVTDSSVTIHHKPTGLRVSVLSHRSQFRNRVQAEAELRALVESSPEGSPSDG